MLERQHAICDDALLVVDVIDESVERGDALPQAGLDAVPLLARDGARDDVERPRAIDRAALLVIHGEGDAHRLDGEFRGLLAHADLLAPELRQIAHQRPPGDARAAARADQLIVQPGRGRRVQSMLM